MLDYLVSLVSRLGDWAYLVIFLGSLLESSAFLGLAVPGEMLVLFGGFLAAEGVLDPFDLAVLVCIGAIIGDSIGYELGRLFGRAWLLRHAHWAGIRERHFERVDRYFARYGGVSVLIGRFIGFLRVLAPFVAGSSRMPYRKFLVFNVLGATLWTAAFVSLGYVLGASWRVAEKWVGRGSLILLGLVVLLAGAAWLWRILTRHEVGIRSWWSRQKQRPTIARLGHRSAALIGFLQARFRPGGAFGLHLTVGLVVVILAAWLFGEVAESIVDREPIVHVDVQVTTWLHEHLTPAMASAMQSISWLGSAPAVTAIGVLLALALASLRMWYRLLTLVLVLPGGALLNELLKHLFHRPRPVLENPLVTLSSYSFPSGHASSALLLYGFIAIVAVRIWTTWRARVSIVLSAALLIALVGFSRIALGVHYLSDVLGAYAEGLLWLAISVTAVETLRRGREASRTKKDVQPTVEG